MFPCLTMGQRLSHSLFQTKTDRDTCKIASTLLAVAFLLQPTEPHCPRRLLPCTFCDAEGLTVKMSHTLIGRIALWSYARCSILLDNLVVHDLHISCART